MANLAQTSIGDNNLSSIKINGEYRVTLFEDTNFQGRSDEINHDEPNLDRNTLGNQYSSARVEGVVHCDDTSQPGVYIYSEKHYKGNCAYVNGDVDDFDNISIGNDGARSLRFVGPFHVVMYEHRNFQGRHDEFGTNQDDLTWRSLGDQYSSLRFYENNKLPTLSLDQVNGQAVSQNGQVFWSNQQLWSFTGSASDQDGSVARVEMNCEGDSCNVRSLPVSGTTSWSYTRGGLSGKNRIYFHAFDDDGARSRTTDRYSVEVNVDLAAPQTIGSLNGEANPANWPMWFTEPVQISLNAQDGATGRALSGVQELHYRLDGGAWQTTQGSSANLQASSDGPHTIEFNGIDKVGNQEELQTSSFQIDATPPEVPGPASETHGVANDQWQRDQNVPTFIWGASSDATSGIWGYQLYFGSDPAGVGYQTFQTGDPLEWTPLPGGTRTGTYYLRGRTRDNAGNLSPWANLFTYRYDGAPPENPGSAVQVDGVENDTWQRTSNAADFSWPVPHDEGSGIQGYYLYWGQDPAGTSNDFHAASQYQGTPLCALDQACTGYLRLRSVDNVDNQAEEWTTSFVLRYDNAPPTVDFTFGGGITQTAQTQLTLHIDGQDQGSGVREMRLSSDGVDWLPWEVYSARRAWTIPAISRQWWPVYIQVKDGVGLESPVVMHEVYLDVNPRQPRSTNFRLFDHTLSAGADDHTSASYQGRGTVGQTADTRPVTSLHYTISGGYEAGSQAIPDNDIVHDDYEYVNGIFASGVMVETMHSASFQVVGTVGERALPNNSTSLTSGSFQHQPGFLAAAPSAVSSGATPPPGPTPEPTPTPACSHPQVLINSGASFTGRTTATLSICAPYAVEMMVSNDESFTGAEWEPYAESKLWQLEVSGQQVLPRFVYVRFQDAAGTVQSTYFDDIVFDPNAPTGEILVGDSVPTGMMLDAAVEADAPSTGTYQIAGSAIKYVTKLHERSLENPLAVLTPGDDGAVDLFLDGRDDNSGLTEMQVSEDPAFAGASWEPFAPETAFTPTEDGITNVYARFRDDAENISSEASASFVYDSMPPIGAVSANRGVVGPSTDAVEVYLFADDELTGVADMRLSTTGDFNETGWRPYTAAISYPITVSTETTLTVYAQFRDLAGNVSEVYSETLAVDLTPPLVAVDVNAGDTLTRTVWVYALDELSEAETLLISNDPLMVQDVEVTHYENLIEWTFDESRTAWIQVVDGVGNVSEPVAAYASKIPAAPTIEVENSLVGPVISWPHLDANGSYEVWRDSEPYFDPNNPLTNTVQLTVLGPPESGSTLVLTDTTALADESYYYLVRGSNGVDASAPSNRVGRFVRPVGPGMNLVSLPLVPATSGIQDVIGEQLSGATSELYADRIWVWQTNIQDYDYAWLIDGVGPPYDGQWWDGDPWGPSSIVLEQGMGFWVQNRQTFSQTLVFVGSVLEAAEHSVEIGEGIQLIGSAYPVERTLYEATFAEDGAHGASSELYADRIWYWDESLQDYDYAWLIDGVGPPYDGQWWDGDPWGETTITLKPGVGYWYQRRVVGPFLWTNPFVLR